MLHIQEQEDTCLFNSNEDIQGAKGSSWSLEGNSPREVNPDPKSGVKPLRQMYGACATFRQLLHHVESPVVITLNQRKSPSLESKSCASHEITHPTEWSPVAMGEQRNSRCEVTGSCSCKPAHRRLRPYGRSPLNWSSIGFDSLLSDWAALSRITLLSSVVWRRG